MNQGEKSEVAKREEEILAFWEREHIFEKSLEKEAPKGDFVFYDGPPFATGLPHSGSLLSSISKDLIPRYKTMRGYRVRSRWGWDTHGLPIESLVEKKLGLKNKKDILALGIEKFNETARTMVLEYVHDWKRYIERVGRFVDFDHSYKTMDNSFIESVWWALKEIHKKGRLYEGRKVLMYCPHCETPLAKAEIAMDNTYKDIEETAVTVKFKVKPTLKLSELGIGQDVHLLAWTTTPWTLPGNVALAVGRDIAYQAVQYESGKYYIVAKERMAALGLADPHMGTEFTGRDLVGLEYEPLYELPKVKAESSTKTWSVLPADFVNTEEGTSIVHTAVLYGEDDYQLGLKEGLPMVPLLNPNATYNDDAPEFLRGEYIRKANPMIIENLRERGLLFKAEPHTHSYPHCYRCGTPLIYNAVSSWFINIQAVKERLLAENEKIHWVPAHLKHGRFGHILQTAPDWTISRNRFWASPLPIWKDVAGNVTIIGSLDELKKYTKKSGNRYFVMRHGEAEHQIKKVFASDAGAYPLTEQGREQVRTSVEKLQKHGITKIYASPVLRCRETAEFVASGLGLAKDSIVYDDRIHEFHFGVFDGRPTADYGAFLDAQEDFYTATPEGGESFKDAVHRFGNFLYEVEQNTADQNILIVAHVIQAKASGVIVEGADGPRARAIMREEQPASASITKLDFVPLPHNADYELDYHLPYIDRTNLVGEKGEPLTRIPEVVDCWVESGSMPFAEYHYPFEHEAEFEKRAPGDFVSEYIGQTRAWFYYLHAMSIELFDRLAFRHVITTGNVLAADGAKLSKSKGNYTDPYELFDRYGADAFRYYLMSSTVMQAEDLTFRDEEVREMQQRVVNILRNVGSFYALFKNDAIAASDTSTDVLDRWILARLRELTRDATNALECYDVPHAARPMREFITDLSTWYVRRSRNRVREGNHEALATLRYVLNTYSKVIAPIMPFVAEELFQLTRVDGDSESVHLAEWPHESLVERAEHALGLGDEHALIEGMTRVRALAADAHELRQKAGIKVRQPLAQLSVPDELGDEFRQILADEVNVKRVSIGHAAVELDTELSSELVREGDAREMARAVAEARKGEGLRPADKAHAELGKEGTYAVELSIGTTRFNLIRDAT